MFKYIYKTCTALYVDLTDSSLQEEAKISTIKRNGNIANNVNQADKDREAFERRALEEREREIKIEEKKKELEENLKQEERLLNEARRRAQTGQAGENFILKGFLSITFYF